MEPKVNLRGMINLDQVEDLLATVLSRVEAQDKRIVDMQEKMKTLMPRQAAERCINEMSEAVKVLSGRVDTIRQASMAKVEDTLVTAGSLSSQNKNKLDEVFHLISDMKSKAFHLEENLKQSLEDHHNSIEKIETDYTPIGMTRALQSGLRECGERIDVCEDSISKKVNKSAFGHIESLVTDLEKYSNHRKVTLEKITSLEEQTLNISNDLGDQRYLLEEHMEKLAKYSSRCNEHSLANEHAICELQRQAQHLSKLIADDCVSSSAFSELLHWSDNANLLMNQFEKKHKESKCLIEQIMSNLSSKLDSEEAYKHYARKDKVFAIIDSMGKDIESRACASQLRGTQCELENLNGAVNQQQSQINIALRFVEWFTHRGDTYENNMQVIDKHLKELAKASVSSKPGSDNTDLREPFSSYKSRSHLSNTRYFNSSMLEEK